MTQQVINVGTAPNDGLGDPIRTSFIKCNDNFTQLYERAQPSPPPTLVGVLGDQAGMYAYDSTYFYYCFADYDGSSTIWAQVTQIANVSLSSINSGNSNIQLADVNGNATISVGGVSNVAVFNTGALLVAGNISATGNITGNYILGNGSQLSGLPETYANANVAAYLLTNTGNISAGNVSATGNVSGGNILSAGLISTSGNIASQGRISATGNIETAGYFVGTFVGNVTGNFVVPGANTQVIFNTNGNADAVGGFTFDTNGPNLLTVLGTISSQGNVVAGNITTSNVITATGNVVGGNIKTAGQVTATGNVTGGNLLTTGLISATGTITSAANIAGANFVTAGIMTATGNISGGNLRATNDIDIGGNVTATNFTGTLVSVTGNVTGGNLRTAGSISAIGNIIGGNILGGANVNATTHTGSTVSVTGNVTSGNILAAGVISATGNITGDYFIGNGSALTGLVVYTNSNVVTLLSSFGSNTISTTGNITAGNFNTGGLLSASGNITGGNLITAGAITATGDVITAGILTVNSGNAGTAIVNGGSNTTGNIGSSSKYFNTIFATATTALYADLAECYSADADYSPGTVVMFGGNAEITACDLDMCVAVAGVISTNPAYKMNSGLSSAHVAPVALTGRVPCQVIGKVNKGSMMVSAGNGRARAEINPVMGSVIGKAIESFDGESGIIEIVVGRL